MRRPTRLFLALAVIAGLCTAGGAWMLSDESPKVAVPTPIPSGADSLRRLQGAYTMQAENNPPRTVLLDAKGHRAAVLTNGARSVLIRGPERVFTEPDSTDARIVTRDWVRIAPKPYPGSLDTVWAWWLEAQMTNTAEDLLAVSQQYGPDSPVRRNEAGVAITGDADFGYERGSDEGVGRDGADFFDFLGVDWKFPEGTSKPDKGWARHLDCSGYLRLVYGYRMGVKLFRSNGIVDGLPRSAWAMADHAPSVVIATAKTSSETPSNLSRIQPGDLVFFALHDNLPGEISHSGIYLGMDTGGRRRFISSRSNTDGPTFGDDGAEGVIDKGYFGDRLRRIIRL